MGFFDRLFGRKTPEPAPPPPGEALVAQSTVAPMKALPPPQQPKALPAPQAPAPVEKNNAAAKSATAAPAAKSAAPAAAKSAAPPKAIDAAKAPAATGDLVDDLIAAVNATFIEDSAAPKNASAAAVPGKIEVVGEDVENLFAEIAAQYARPLKEFVVELRRGTATREWIDLCRPALTSISKAARSMNLPKAAERMEDFDVALAHAAQSRERNLTAQEQARLLERYDRMVEIMPKAFSINEQMKHRDTIIIMSLLKQIPEVGRVTIDKLYAAGLTSVDVLLLAKKDELAVATGISIKLAEQICDKLAKYREESSGTKRVDMKGYRQRLGELVVSLKKANDAYNKASDADDAAGKRTHRGSRQNLVFQISILLAELGEAEFVKELDKLTFERRIQALEEFLARTAQRK
jgi:hypothetical protein